MRMYPLGPQATHPIATCAFGEGKPHTLRSEALGLALAELKPL
jgi:hypothetical protein